MATALSGATMTYVRECPVEWQERALDLLGIDAVIRLDETVDLTIGIVR